ncbi:MAG TPA: hypothetical protein VKR05_00880, partial [Candidatus Cybelea sp.]|nr:hypothetical protein [Candidatus Cybelea sp.]
MSTRRWSAGCAIALLAALLSACNGGSGTNGTIPSNPVPPVMQNQMAPVLAPDLSDDSASPDTLSPINTYPGEIVGTDNMFKPTDGDTPTGGHGRIVGKLKCSPSEYLTD